MHWFGEIKIKKSAIQGEDRGKQTHLQSYKNWHKN